MKNPYTPLKCIYAQVRIDASSTTAILCLLRLVVVEMLQVWNVHLDKGQLYYIHDTQSDKVKQKSQHVFLSAPGIGRWWGSSISSDLNQGMTTTLSFRNRWNGGVVAFSCCNIGIIVWNKVKMATL